MKKNEGNILLIILAVVGIVATSVGGYFWWSSQKPKVESVTVANPKSIPDTESIDNRMLLTRGPEGGYYGKPPVNKCDITFNVDMPTNYVRSSANLGILIDVPYNSKWGNSKFRINPYDYGQNGLAFGPLGAGEDCTWYRSMGLYVANLETKEQIISRIKDSRLAVGRSDMGICDDPQIKSRDNLTFLEYSCHNRVGKTLYIEMLGTKYNYGLYSRGIFTDDQALKILEAIVQSAKLLPLP